MRAMEARFPRNRVSSDSNAKRSTVPHVPHNAPKGPRALENATSTAEVGPDQPVHAEVNPLERTAFQPSAPVDSTPPISTPAPGTAKTNSTSKHIPGFVTAEEHERALDRIAQLSHDLNTRITEAETASKACRELAIWTCNERNRLHQEMTAAKSGAIRKFKQAREAFPGELREALVAETEKFIAENGLASMQLEDVVACFQRAVVAYGRDTAEMDNGDGMGGQTDGAAVESGSHMQSDTGESTASVMEQVGKLIAEEVGHLIQM